MTVLDIIVFIAVFGVIGYIGYVSNKKIKGTDDFFTARRSLGKIDAGLSMAATEFGGASLVGSIGIIYVLGVGGAMYSWSVVPPLLLMVWLVADKLQPLALTTVPEFLGQKYGSKTRTLSSLMHMAANIADLSGQFFICATTLNLLLGVDKTVSYWLTLVFVLLYTVGGGLIAVVKTDVFQFIIIAISLFALTICSWNAVGGVTGITSAGLAESFFDWGSFGLGETISWVLWGVFAYSTNQHYLQRVFASKDRATARFSYTFTAGVFFICGFVSIIIGLAAVVLMPGVENEDSVYIAMALEYLPMGLRGLAAAGIFAATMSTADSSIMAASSLFVMDIYKPLFWKGDDDQKLLGISRICTVIITLLGVIIGVYVTSIVEMIYLGGLFYSTAVFFPLILGLFWKKASSGTAAFCSIIAAVAMGAFSEFYLTVNFTSGILALPSNVMGSGAGLIVFVLLTLLAKKEDQITA